MFLIQILRRCWIRRSAPLQPEKLFSGLVINQLQSSDQGREKHKDRNNLPGLDMGVAVWLVAVKGRAFVPKDKILPLIPRGDFSPVGEPNREVHERSLDVMVDLHRGQGLAVDCASQLSRASWEKVISDQWVLSTITHGYRLQFRRRPPPFSRVRMTIVKDPLLEPVLREEVQALLQKGAITKVPFNAQQTGFYSTYFIIPKKEGGHRPILDLRHLNQYLKILPFKMIHTKMVMQAIRAGEWFTSLDLKDAYFHVPICPEHRPFLRFAFQGQAFQFQVLPFGLSLAPRVFTRVISAALAPLQLRGIKILPYLDDWLICAPSREQVVRNTEEVLAHIQSLGFTVN